MQSHFMPLPNNGGSMEKEKILEGWKEIADAIGNYHPDYVRRLFRKVRSRLPRKYWLGPGHRIIMTSDELKEFKTLISMKTPSKRPR